MLSYQAGLIEKIKAQKLGRNWAYILLGCCVLAVLIFTIPSTALNSETTSSSQSNFETSYGGLFVSIALKLGVVVLLIYVTLLIIKRWQIGKVGVVTRQLSILETARLSPHQSILLVKVNQRYLLIGATDQTINCLGEVERPEDNPLQVVQLNQQPPHSSLDKSSFVTLLANRLLKRKNQPTT